MGVEWNEAIDIKIKVEKLVFQLELEWIKNSQIFCFRSKNSTSRAYARIWGLNKVWQKALSQNPSYIIEVLSERFDKLSDFEKDKVLLHELAHIPKNFSGSLLPHIRRGKRNFHDKVEGLVAQYKAISNTRN